MRALLRALLDTDTAPISVEASSPFDCNGADGNLLGLGIRLGSYIQALAVLVTRIRRAHDDATGLSEAALLAAMATLAVSLIQVRYRRDWLAWTLPLTVPRSALTWSHESDTCR